MPTGETTVSTWGGGWSCTWVGWPGPAFAVCGFLPRTLRRGATTSEAGVATPFFFVDALRGTGAAFVTPPGDLLPEEGGGKEAGTEPGEPGGAGDGLALAVVPYLFVVRLLVVAVSGCGEGCRQGCGDAGDGRGDDGNGCGDDGGGRGDDILESTLLIALSIFQLRCVSDGSGCISGGGLGHYLRRGRRRWLCPSRYT